MDFSALNDEQRLAVIHPIGTPAAICAGAGSGKTTVLTARIKHLIDDEVSPKRILALTFTNKAANEILERVGMAAEPNHPWIGTIHSLALSAIRRAPKGFGLNEKVTPLDEYDQKEMLKKLIEDRELGDILNPYLLKDKLSYHRARGVGFRVDYTSEVHQKALVAHAGYHAMSTQELEIWLAYEKQKTHDSVVDFDDMIHLFVRRGQTDEKWLHNLQRQFDFVLMDEAQDTNEIQWSMINLLLPPGNFNMLCVGDINQSIYGFNGANPGILLNYTKEWRGVQPKLYKLERNHRSVPEIVTLANKVQTFMTDTIPLRMESHRGGKDEHGQIILRHSNTPRDLAESISVEILNKTAKVQYKDIAILVRAGSQVRDIETELVKNRIPYIIRGAMGLLQAEEVKDILSYLKIASNPHDFSAMRRSSMVPKRGVGDAALDKVLLNANLKHEGNLIESLRGSQLQKLGGYLNIVDELMRRSHDPSDAIDYLVRAIGYESYLRKKYEKHKDKIEQKLNNIVRLKEMINALMAEREMTIDDVVFQLTMQDQKDIGGEGKIVISTIHAAKGLEWKTVYVVGLYDGSLPHKFCTSDEEISEERRLFYVACTRAKDTLVLGVPAAIEFAYKEPQWVAPSRFLTELGVCK